MADGNQNTVNGVEVLFCVKVNRDLRFRVAFQNGEGVCRHVVFKSGDDFVGKVESERQLAVRFGGGVSEHHPLVAGTDVFIGYDGIIDFAGLASDKVDNRIDRVAEFRGDAADVLRQLRENPKAEKGEYCLILDFHDVRLPEEKSPAADVSLEARLIDEMVRNGLTLRDAQSELVLDGEKKNAVKAAALRLKKLFEEDDA